MRPIYLDYAATTPVDPFVLARMNEVATDYFANPSSQHKSGQKSKVLLEKSRQQIAAAINALPSEIIFTSGGSEGNNHALYGACRINRQRGKHIISTRVEHPSVMEPLNTLVREGFHVSYLNVDQDGNLNYEQLGDLIGKDTILVSVMHVNNETGNIFPINKIKSIIGDRPIILHCDAVQSLDKIDISVDELGVDLFTFSAHKVYGPKGCGALYVRRGTYLKNLIAGGAQEQDRRAGTENLPAIAGFAEAIRQMDLNKNNRQKIDNMRNLFERELISAFPDIRINGKHAERVPHISNIYFPFLSGESLFMNLDLHNIAVSSGSACSSGSQKISHVLTAMGYTQERVAKSLRFSFGRKTTEDQIYQTIDVLKKIRRRVNYTSSMN